MQFFKGIECNILSHGETATDVPLKLAAEFDVVIASIHPLEHVFIKQSQEQLTEEQDV